MWIYIKLQKTNNFAFIIQIFKSFINMGNKIKVFFYKRVIVENDQGSVMEYQQ